MAGMDPSGGGGIGQPARDLVKELQRAQADGQQADKQAGGSSNHIFQQAMAAQAQQQGVQAAVSTQAAQATQSGIVSNQIGINQLIKEKRANDKLATTKVGETEKTAENKFTSMIEGLVNSQDKMTKIMNMALSGRQFNPSELLAMQAGVYRFTQELDLSSKVVEKATGSIKQTLNTQV